MEQLNQKSPDRGNKEPDFSLSEAWIKRKQQLINEEAKEKHWQYQNRFYPFANLNRLIDYPKPDKELAFELLKERKEGWSKMHEEMADYDGGYEAYLAYGNDSEWVDDIDQVCMELAEYKYHWLIGRMIQIRHAYNHFKWRVLCYGARNFFRGLKQAIGETFFGRYSQYCDETQRFRQGKWTDHLPYNPEAENASLH